MPKAHCSTLRLTPGHLREEGLPSAEGGTVVLLANLTELARELAHLLEVVSTDELLYAQSLCESVRNQVICSRALLRFLLGQQLAVDAASLRFACGPHGKPELIGHQLAFNTSRSDDTFAVALASRGQVGVDVEKFRPISGYEEITRGFLRNEAPIVFSGPEERRHRSFLRIWTCKEAVVKAIGLGLTAPLNGFAVSLDPPAITPLQPEFNRHWSLETVIDGDVVLAAAVAL